MSIDFPFPAANGQLHSAAGATWRYDGTKWVSYSAGGDITGVTAGTGLTGGGTSGDVTLNLSIPVSIASGGTGATTTTAALTNLGAAPSGAVNDVGRNLLQNGLFTVWQRGTGSWNTDNVYTADRWICSTQGSLDTISFYQGPLNDTARAQIGDEAATYFLGNTFTGNAAAGAATFIEQRIEGVRRLAGKTVTLSFWAYAQSGTPKLGFNAFQIFGTGGSPSAYVQVLATGAAFMLSQTWTRYQTAFSMPSITGKTLGTNGNDSTFVRFYYSSGATNNQAAGNIGVQSGTVQLWGIQLEIGSTATPLEKLDPRMDVANCQRFFSIKLNVGFDAWNGSSGSVAQHISFPTAMRGIPSITFTNHTTINTSGPLAFDITTTGFKLYANAATANSSVTYSGDIAASADL